jgi:hypothetical protein
MRDVWADNAFKAVGELGNLRRGFHFKTISCNETNSDTVAARVTRQLSIVFDLESAGKPKWKVEDQCLSLDYVMEVPASNETASRISNSCASSPASSQEIENLPRALIHAVIYFGGFCL